MQFDYPDFKLLSVEEVQEYFSSCSGELAELIAESKVALDQYGGLLPSGLAVYELLRQLDVDETTAMAALLGDSRLRESWKEVKVRERYGEAVADLVERVRWLHSFRDADSLNVTVPEQAERVRRLLMQASADARAILIKLAYRVERMRNLSQEPEDVQQYIARETMDIYAPLANRLGIGQLKWELEDFSFRYLEPDVYKHIAKSLEERRQDREQYLIDFVGQIEMLLEQAGISANVAGRPKHIYSIVKKMRQKSLGFEELFDVRAVRIIVDSLADCYGVLGLVHNRWDSISAEFDDYIAKPKPNGYQSLHTVVVGPHQKAVEIQIRTQAMHELAESGVAAHWRYKEQEKSADEALERNIQALRQLLESGEVDEELLSQFQSDVKNKRVYVFTPTGDVVDLAEGATPLDFAYAIHTQVGHRCKGAKVNGAIVPLNYALKDADKVEIITAKEASPTREWLNPKLGYIHSTHTRSKLRNWFNKLDYEQHVEDGGYIFERELNRYNGRSVTDERYVEHFSAEGKEEMLADIGRGKITTNQLLSAIQVLTKPIKAIEEQGRRRKAPKDGVIQVLGVGNLMTHRAACCQPIPGDAIIGFITQGRGVSVHRQNCQNIKALSPKDNQRLIPVEWGGEKAEKAEAELYVQAFDREGLLRDITSVLSKEHVHLNAINTRSDREQQMATMNLTVELGNTEQLALIVDKLSQIPNILEVRRVAH